MQVLKSTLVCIACFLLFFAGVVREDVGREKYLALGRQKQFNSVGQIFTNTGSHGSCVLVGKKFVVSAAHIFMTYITRQDTMILGGQKAVVNLPIDAKPVNIKDYVIAFNDKVYRCKSIIIHPNYDWKKSDFDLVLIELENEVQDIQPAKMNTSFNEAGAFVTGVGYGASGYANDPQTVLKNNLKIGGENTIDSIGGALYNGQRTLLVCDFDSKDKPELNRIGSAQPRPLEYISSGGDSGGGMFRYINKQWELVGIAHSGELDVKKLMKTGYYGLLMSWTRVAAYSDWIKTNIQ